VRLGLQSGELTPRPTGSGRGGSESNPALTSTGRWRWWPSWRTRRASASSPCASEAARPQPADLRDRRGVAAARARPALARADALGQRASATTWAPPATSPATRTWPRWRSSTAPSCAPATPTSPASRGCAGANRSAKPASVRSRDPAARRWSVCGPWLCLSCRPSPSPSYSCSSEPASSSTSSRSGR
jgi:hypothetical protein